MTATVAACELLTATVRLGSALVARWIRIISAARGIITWRIVSTSGSSTNCSSAEAHPNCHSGAYTAVHATAINAPTIHADTPSIISRGVLCESPNKPDAHDDRRNERKNGSA
jgi:hypothetical protein